MFRLSEKLKVLEDKINGFFSKQKDKLPKLILLGTVILYFYGMVVRLIGVGALNFRNATNEEWFTLNPFKNIGAIFTPYGIMITLFIVLMYCLFTKKGYQLPAIKRSETKNAVLKSYLKAHTELPAG